MDNGIVAAVITRLPGWAMLTLRLAWSDRGPVSISEFFLQKAKSHTGARSYSIILPDRLELFSVKAYETIIVIIFVVTGHGIAGSGAIY